MPLPAALRRQIDLRVLRDFAAELEAALASDNLDEVGRRSATYHLGLAREGIAYLERQGA
jgi:hypothetical protein